MNLLTQNINPDWVHALGWTLLHSLWQSLIIFLVVAALFRAVPSLRAGVRYAIACGALLLILAFSGATFLHMVSDARAIGETAVASSGVYHTVAFNSTNWQQGADMSWLVISWLIGFLVLTLRSTVGFFKLYNLRSEAYALDGEWGAYVRRTASALGIRQLVGVAESTRISGPLVIGFFKPLILIPVGMVGGLTTQQLETVFLHELAHIRRHDYLVNLLQTVVESALFFNPFVWMLSNVIRREREYCCDDLVVKLHGNTSAYARALVALAETRLASPAFALSLIGNKNELLNRIKRIMEQSTKSNASKSQWLISVMLLITALVGICWISVDKNANESNSQRLLNDSVTSGYGYTVRYSRINITALDDHGLTHATTIQRLEGDETLSIVIDNALVTGFSDTIPPFSPRDWDAFAKAFDTEFREDLQFFLQRNRDPHQLMEELERTFLFGSEGCHAPFDKLDSLKRLHNGDIFKNFREEFEKLRGFGGEGFEQLERNFRSFDGGVQHL